MLRQVVCSSVRPSVTLRYRDHIGCKSSKIISRLVCLGCSLFATPPLQIYYKRNASEIFAGIVYLQARASECPDVKNYKCRLNPVWHSMLYTCTYMAQWVSKG